MTQQIQLDVKAREASGRGPCRRLRREGFIPGVIYGKASETRSIALNQAEFSRLIKKAAGAASLVQLKEDGKGSTLTVIQETQVDPITDRVLHVDFHEVSSKEKMETHVSIHLNGEAAGVKIGGGVLEVVLHSIEIRCLPKDLPGFIEVDVSGLNVDQAIHVRELPELKGVEYQADPDQVVVSCMASRVGVEPAVETAVEEEEAEESKEKVPNEKESKEG